MIKTTIVATAMAMMLLSGCSDTGSNTPVSNDTNAPETVTDSVETNTTGDEPTVYTSSAGVYLAESNESDKNGYMFFTHPVYIGTTLYTRQYRAYNFDVDAGMKVIAYDLASFGSDVNLSDLYVSTLYEQDGPNYTTAHFNQRYYDIAEVGGALYFSTMPESVDTLSQSSYIKYEISSDSELYHQKATPWMGENLDTTFDLARGWFLPFNNDTQMGVVEDGINKVFWNDAGAFYKYNVYDYFGAGETAGLYTDGRPPVGNDDHFFFAAQKLYNVSYLSDHVEYGARRYAQDPEYKINNILNDALSMYSGSKVYTNANNSGDLSAVSPLVLDGNTLYCVAFLSYEDSNGFTKRDMYLLEYDGASTLQKMTLLGEESTAGNYFDVTQLYKYKNDLYFQFRHDGESEFCSYSLTTDAYNYKLAVGDHPRFDDLPMSAYAITGDEVIIPQKIKTADYDAENSTESTFFYHLVFKVYNISDGTFVKTLQHKELMGLRYPDNDVYIYDAYSDDDSLYFTGKRSSSDRKHNLLIKIDSSGNSVNLSRFRADAHLSGVLVDHP